MKRWVKRAVGSALALLVLLSSALYFYTKDYYHAQEQVVSVFSMADHIEVYDDYTVLAADSAAGLIFYPGAKVEETAYLPLLSKLQQAGITCVLIKMPLHLAFLNPNAADDVLAELSQIKHWYMAGHSLGGAMASAYAAEHMDKIEGVILLGAYVYGDLPDARALVIYGSEDGVLNRNQLTSVTITVIKGGNHAQFGCYGIQAGDGEASISAEEQQAQSAAIITEFIQSSAK